MMNGTLKYRKYFKYVFWIKEAYYSCSNGYFLTGPSVRHCLYKFGADSYWDGEDPTCRSMNK